MRSKRRRQGTRRNVRAGPTSARNGCNAGRGVRRYVSRRRVLQARAGRRSNAGPSSRRRDRRVRARVNNDFQLQGSNVQATVSWGRTISDHLSTVVGGLYGSTPPRVQPLPCARVGRFFLEDTPLPFVSGLERPERGGSSHGGRRRCHRYRVEDFRDVHLGLSVNFPSTQVVYQGHFAHVIHTARCRFARGRNYGRDSRPIG